MREIWLLPDSIELESDYEVSLVVEQARFFLKYFLFSNDF